MFILLNRLKINTPPSVEQCKLLPDSKCDACVGVDQPISCFGLHSVACGGVKNASISKQEATTHTSNVDGDRIKFDHMIEF